MITRLFVLLVVVAAGYLMVSQSTAMQSWLRNLRDSSQSQPPQSELAQLHQQLRELRYQVAQLEQVVVVQSPLRQPLQSEPELLPQSQPDHSRPASRPLMDLVNRMELKALQYSY